MLQYTMQQCCNIYSKKALFCIFLNRAQRTFAEIVCSRLIIAVKKEKNAEQCMPLTARMNTVVLKQKDMRCMRSNEGTAIWATKSYSIMVHEIAFVK
jgi:hypothetical protein